MSSMSINLKKVLDYIHEDDIEPKRVMAICMDIFPSEDRERKLLNMAVISGIADKIRTLSGEPLHRKQNFVRELVDDYGMRYDIAENIIGEWCDFYVSLAKINLSRIEKEAAKLFKTEDFFTDHVYMLASPDAFMNMWNPGADDKYIRDDDLCVVPPIKGSVLGKYTADEIKKYFSIKSFEDGEVYKITAAFDLPYTYKDSNGNKKNSVYRIEKTYSELDEEHFMMNDDWQIAEIWPNVKLNNWNRYYFVCINSGAKRERIIENILLFTPWSRKCGCRDYNGKNIDCMTNEQIVRLNEFPEVLLCSVNWKTDNKVSEKIDVGLLVIDQPEHMRCNEGIKWDIGIDIGNFSTAIYHRGKDRESTSLVIRHNLYQLMNKIELYRATLLLYDFIWPVNKNDNGIYLTNYNVKKEKEYLEPLIDGNIFGLPMHRVNELKHWVRNVKCGLTWSASSDSKKYYEAFLEQLCLQVAVEAIKAGASCIKWNIAYPYHLSRNEMDDYKRMVNRTIKMALTGTSFEEKSIEVGFYQKGHAGAMFFEKHKNNKSKYTDGAICLDIGYASTNVTISGRKSDDYQLLYNLSMQYAGKTICGPIYQIITQLVEAEEIKNIEDDVTRSIAEAGIIMNTDDKYMQMCVDILSGNEKNKELIEHLLQISQLAVAGLFYYVGTVLWVMKEYNIFEGDSIPDIYIGGNGSRVIEWIDCSKGGEPVESKLNILKKAIQAGADMDYGETEIVVSDNPKSEVAAGMLCEKEVSISFDDKKMLQRLYGDNADDIVLKSVISGMSIESGEEQIDAVSYINAHDIKNGIKNFDFSELDNLAAVYNESSTVRWGNTIDINKYKAELKKRVVKYYDDERKKDIDDMCVEPVFIVTMRLLIDIMLEEVKKNLK